MLFRNHLSTVESNCLPAKNRCFRGPLYYIKEQPSVWILENSCFQSSKNIYIYIYISMLVYVLVFILITLHI